MRRILLLALIAGAAPAGAQARYLPQAEPLYYHSVNPYRMYVVVRGDTVGEPVRSRNAERHVWRQSGEGLAVDVRIDDVPGERPRVWDVLQVSPRGVVTAIPVGEKDHQGRWDFVLRLPADGDLRPGRVWHDTLSITAGENAFQAWRELRVDRIADTLGSRIAVVRGTGTLRYRDTWPAARGKTWWIDVTGPMEETFLFDLDHGRMSMRQWRMELRGTAGLPSRAGGTDTLPAGLISANTTRAISAARWRRLAREDFVTKSLRPGPRRAIFSAAESRRPGAPAFRRRRGDRCLVKTGVPARNGGPVEAGPERVSTEPSSG